MSTNQALVSLVFLAESETVHTKQYNELYEAEAVPVLAALPASTTTRASTVNTYAAQQAARRSKLVTQVSRQPFGQPAILPDFSLYQNGRFSHFFSDWTSCVDAQI